MCCPSPRTCYASSGRSAPFFWRATGEAWIAGPSPIPQNINESRSSRRAASDLKYVKFHADRVYTSTNPASCSVFKPERFRSSWLKSFLRVKPMKMPLRSARYVRITHHAPQLLKTMNDINQCSQRLNMNDEFYFSFRHVHDHVYFLGNR